MSEKYSIEFDDNDLDNLEQEALNISDAYNQRRQAEEASIQAEEQVEQQAADVRYDPRDADTWGAKALIKEGQSILSGGLQDTASSLATFPERTADALSGEMQKQRLETGRYRPDWTPFNSYDNPIETKTWWGKQLRGLIHFGSMAAGTILAAKGAVATGLVTIPAGLTALASSTIARGAAIGAVSDLISKESDEQNALGALRDRYGWVDTPISTKDTDHPIMMKVKNIVEGMGIGLIFDGLAYTLKKGSKEAVDQIINRNKSLKNQTVQAGIAQLRRGEAEFRADKNAPSAQPHQGAHISEVEPQVARDQLSQTRKDYGSEDGSTGSVTTPVERESIAMYGATDEATVERIFRGLVSSEKFAKELEAAKGSRKALVEKFKESIESHQRVTQGRNPVEMSPEEYLKELFETNDVIDGFEVWTSKNVVTADLILGTLLKQLRDTGIAGREIADLVSLDDIDGPAKQIVDTMLTALYQTKKSRFVKSDSFRALGAAKKTKTTVEEAVSKEMVDARESIMSILKIAKDDDNDDMINALFEAFSMMDNVNTLDDFDRWARTLILGGKLDVNGPDRTGVMIRELEGVMTHSVLSGPKTPARAIMGTSAATFLRPLATALGYTLKAPFTGEVAAMRASLASVNAMIEAVPESLQLFKTKLNAYWKGDIRTIKTRFSEFSQGDDNWEIVRRWAEDSGRANAGEVAAFRVANLARNANNANLLTYSTKLMAATDDAFAYILGRAKMREKAMRNALELQNNGIQTPKITRDLMKAYEDDFYAQVFDSAGNIVDEATQFARKEVTLTQDLTGFAKGLNDVFSATPLAKPFFLFARTGVNGLALTGKYTPGFNFLVKEFNDIAFANPNDLGNVGKYGIFTPEELANARALQVGRLAIGSAVVFTAVQAWMRGDLHGNGPADRQKRQMWFDNRWEPRTIKLGDVRVGYDNFEPFNLIMSTIADVGDASELMGVDLFGGRRGQIGRISGSLFNNSMPLAGLRNELGKLFTPYMRELNSGIRQSIRNRNAFAEGLTGINPLANPLPIKYDMLNGRPLKDWDFLTRAYNAVSPISLNLEQTPGRDFLFDSGYDLRMSTYYAPDSTNLTDTPEIRSKFQRAIGIQNLERQLDKLAANPKAIASMNQMYADIKSGRRGDFDARDYWHNRQIDKLFQKARRIAWNSIRAESDVMAVIEEQRRAKIEQIQKQKQTANILNIYK